MKVKNVIMSQLFSSERRKNRRHHISGPEWFHTYRHRVKTLSAVFILTLGVFLVIQPSDTLGQSVTLTGKISDSTTGQSIAGAEVILEQLNRVASTDSDGRYIFRRVSSGEYSLVVQAIGYQSADTTLVIESDEEINTDLERISYDGDRIFVSEYRNGQARSLNRQLKTGQFNYVLNSGQSERFADYSIQDAVRRVPGVQVSRTNKIYLRGVGLDQSYVTIDGQRMASTGAGNRSVDLAAISSDMVRELEVINIIRPDMDPEALPGALNLITRRAAGGERQLSLSVGGGANTEYSGLAGSSSRFSVNYSEPLLDELTLVVDLQRDVEQNAFESLGIEYGVADFGSGPVDVLERVSPGIQTDGRGRWGGRLQLTYEPSNRTIYNIRGLFTSENRQQTRNRNSWIANGVWEDQNLTGTQGFFEFDSSLKNSDIRNYLVQAGGKHLFDFFNLEYNLGWAFGGLNQTTYRLPFRNMGVEHTTSLENRNRPVMEMVDTPLRADNMRLLQMDNIKDNHFDNTFSGSVDAEVPFSFGSIKIGSKISQTQKDAFDAGAYREFLYTFRGNLFLNGFEMEDENPGSLFGNTYPLPWLIKADEGQRFFDTNVPNFLLDEELFRRRSDIWNYQANEQIVAGYGMATFDFGPLTVMGGARVEYTDAEYSGRVVEFNRFDRYEQTIDTTREGSYTNLFPHAQISYKISDRSTIGAAYSKTMSRPDFNLLSPFELITASDTTLFRGNPELKPVFSDNFDLFYEQNFRSIGAVSISLFYKNISDFIRLEQSTVDIQEGDIAIFDPLFTEEVTTLQANESKFQNSSETASVYGVQLSWQQYLNFLPESFGQFGTYLNYTWSQSEYNGDREEETDFPGQSPHVVNAALNHAKGRLSTQVSFHRTSPALSNLVQGRSLAPSVNSQNEVYRDRYEDGWMDLRLSVRFRITDNFRFWTDVYNLIGNERVQYVDDRDVYPVQIQSYEGVEFRMGIRFDL